MVQYFVIRLKNFLNIYRKSLDNMLSLFYIASKLVFKNKTADDESVFNGLDCPL